MAAAVAHVTSNQNQEGSEARQWTIPGCTWVFVSVCVCVFYMGLDVRKIAVGVECVCAHSLSTGHEQDGQAAEDREDHGDDDQDSLGQPGAAALVPLGFQNQSLAALAEVSLPAPGESKRVRPEERGGVGGGGGVGAWGQTLTCTRAPAGLRSTCSRRERSSARGWRCRDPAWSSGWTCTHW